MTWLKVPLHRPVIPITLSSQLHTHITYAPATNNTNINSFPFPLGWIISLTRILKWSFCQHSYMRIMLSQKNKKTRWQHHHMISDSLTTTKKRPLFPQKTLQTPQKVASPPFPNEAGRSRLLSLLELKLLPLRFKATFPNPSNTTEQPYNSTHDVIKNTDWSLKYTIFNLIIATLKWTIEK